MAETATVPMMLTIRDASLRTALTYWYISQLVKTNQIRSVKSGRKTYVNFSSLCSYLNGGNNGKV